MNLNLKFCVLSALLVLLLTCTRLRGSSSGIFGKAAFTTAAVLAVSNLNEAEAIPPPLPFFHRLGLAGGRSLEEDESEEDNESQARVEPQITSLNRDECLAKLLCGMSVPVTGTGAPKEGYYSEYANIVARFFEAFPLEDDEKNQDSSGQSPESLELYDDYSLEDTVKPARINSKKRRPESPSKSSTGLQLIDLALIKSSSDSSANKTQTEDDDERTGREGFIKTREARARKIVAKLGDKLQTVRQCKQIAGCPFTFKQLRSRLKSPSSITSNVPLGGAPSSSSSSSSINYNYNQPGPKRPSSPFLGSSSLTPHSPHKGDDEIEEFYGPPPVVIKRPPGFGMNQVSYTSANKQQQQGEQYAPYDPHTKTTPTLSSSSSSGPLFPSKKIQYQLQGYKKKAPGGENDEFDDVNKSTGPVKLVGDETSQGGSGNNEGNSNGQGDNDDNNNESGENYDDDDDGDYDGNDDYDDEGDNEEYDDDDNDDTSGEGDEEEEEDTSGEDGEKEVKKKQNGNGKKKRKKGSSSGNEENDTEGGTGEIGSGQNGVKTKPKVINYKKPSLSPNTAIVIEEEFESKKRPGEDDELEHPDNVWSKYGHATTGGLLKQPSKDRVKTPLEEKNDEKLKVSTTSGEIKKKEEASAEDSSEEEEEEDEDEEQDDGQEAERSVRRRPSETSSSETSDKKEPNNKFSIEDDDEFEATKDFIKKYKPKRRINPKYGGDHGESGKRRKVETEAKKTKKDQEKTEKEVEEKDESASEEEEGGDSNKRGQIETIITHIGGRPIVPPPESKKNSQKKVGGLGRFKFNLVRPYGGGGLSEGDEENEDKTPALLPAYSSNSGNKKRTTVIAPPKEYQPSLPSYVRPSPTPKSSKKSKKSSSSKSSLPSYSFKSESSSKIKPSYDPDTRDSQSEGYIPKVSFGSSNAGKLGTVEYLGAQSAAAQSIKPSVIAFPFSNPLTSLKSLFQRPTSGGNQDIPGAAQNSAPVFVQRPIGPESSKFRRISTSSSGSSKKGYKKGKKGSKKGGNKKYKRRH